LRDPTFPTSRRYEKLLPNIYTWHEFRIVNIRIHRDLAEAITIDLSQLQLRYGDVDMREEPGPDHR
jgi:hypothetical protein